MGYSPGEFKDKEGNSYHVELTGGRVIIWNHNESHKLLDLDTDNAYKLLTDLNIILEDI